jgi:hypothetical protein
MLAAGAWGDALAIAQGLMGPTYERRASLVRVLLEDDAGFRDATGRYDIGKVAESLEKNGLLRGGGTQRMVISNEEGVPRLFFVLTRRVLHDLGAGSPATERMRHAGDRAEWAFEVRNAPKISALAAGFARYGARLTAAETDGSNGWKLAVSMADARLKTRRVEPGTSVKILRPIEPIWLDVSGIDRVVVRELPGSHWYPDLVVYDKMLHTLYTRQKDERTRYVSVKLPKEAAYVRIDDRFTRENLRNGLRVTAKGER